MMIKIWTTTITAVVVLLSSWVDANAQRTGGRRDAPQSCSEAYGRCNSSCGRGRGQVDNCQSFCTTTRAACLRTGTWQGNQNTWQGLARN
jgi:hypothetical protein